MAAMNLIDGNFTAQDPIAAGSHATHPDIAVFQAEIERLTTLNAELNARPTMASVIKRKVIAPEFYKGAEGQAVLHHLTLTENYVRSLGLVRDEDVLPAAVELLRGGAQTWWLNLQNRGSAPVTWAEYKALLTTRFNGANAEFKARCMFDDLRQSSSVDSYVTQFESLGIQAGYTSQSEDMAAHLKFKFLKGLKESTRNLVMQQQPADYGTAKALALQQESIAYCARTMDSGTSSRPRSPSPNFHRGRQGQSSASSSSSASHPRSSSTPMELGSMQAGRKGDNRVQGNGKSRGGGRPQLPRANISKAEEQRRKDNNLCLYCGEDGHYARSCPARQQAQG
jgi:hypothetical protein